MLTKVFVYTHNGSSRQIAKAIRKNVMFMWIARRNFEARRVMRCRFGEWSSRKVCLGKSKTTGDSGAFCFGACIR
nr:hypothetical protein [Paenibacillus lautus]